jgi:hypothetical protein
MNVFSLSEIISTVNWFSFLTATLVVFGIGAIWFSVLFTKTWIRIFRIEMSEKITTGSFIRTMLLQFIANVLFGFVFFILTKISITLAVIALTGFCAWEKGTLNFQFAKIKDFITATFVSVGYTFLAGIVFILFGLI